MISSTIYNFYSYACLLFAFSGLFCGLVRWFHMCNPYDKEWRHYYPARRYVAFSYVIQMLMIPYVLDPLNESNWIYLISFGILYYPTIFTILIQRYFLQKEMIRRWKQITYGVAPTIFILIMLYYIANDSSYIVQNKYQFLTAAKIIGVLQLLFFFQALHWLFKRIRQNNYDNYSNTDDFPKRFAKKIFFMPSICVIPMWIVFLTQSRTITMYTDLFFAFWNIFFLMIILHPNKYPSSLEAEKDEEIRQIEMERIEEQIGLEIDNKSKELEDERNDIDQEITYKIKKAIIYEMEENHAYLEPHFTLNDLCKRINFNRTYTSRVCMAEWNGFYRLVNSYRLNCYKKIIKERPNETKESAILSSGFGSRQSFYKAVKNMDDD